MPKNPPQIELRWRDENYGSVYAVAACPPSAPMAQI